jgi:hypothetical protein
MQNPTDQAGAEASIPTEPTVTSNDPTDQAEASIAADTTSIGNRSNWNHTVAVRRKVAKRTHHFDLVAEELNLVSSTPQPKDIPPARKKPRLEEPHPTTTDEAARKAAPADVSAGRRRPPPAADDDTNADPKTDTQPNAGATRRRWTLEEDAKLTTAVTNTSKMKWRKKYKTDRDAVAMLVPGRTSTQCIRRWKDFLDPSIDRASGRAGNWTIDEDKKLKDAVLTHGGKNWETIGVLVPGRTKIQCSSRWQRILDTNIDPTTARAGRWTADEDKKLNHALLTHGSEDWATITALVPGRTKMQCSSRWHHFLDPSIDHSNRHSSKWTTDEDEKLKDAVQTHGGNDWATIAALVPGRTKIQCRNRWQGGLAENIDPTTARAGKWSEDEDNNLKDAVQTHDGKDWDKIAALVPGRTKKQCSRRWHRTLKPNIDRTSGRTGK